MIMTVYFFFFLIVIPSVVTLSAASCKQLCFIFPLFPFGFYFSKRLYRTFVLVVCNCMIFHRFYTNSPYVLHKFSIYSYIVYYIYTYILYMHIDVYNFVQPSMQRYSFRMFSVHLFYIFFRVFILCCMVSYSCMQPSVRIM